MQLQSALLDALSPTADAAGLGHPPADDPQSMGFHTAMTAVVNGQDVAQVPLQSEPLGSPIQLITPQAPGPEVAELKAFAQAQGIDPQAVAWLFGQHAPAPTPEGSAALAHADHSTPGLTELDAQALDDATALAHAAALALLQPTAGVWGAGALVAPAATPAPGGAEPNVLPAGWTSGPLLMTAALRSQAQAVTPNAAAQAMAEEVFDLLELDPDAAELIDVLQLGERQTGKTGTHTTLPGQSNLLDPKLALDSQPLRTAGTVVAAPAAIAEPSTAADRAAQLQALAQKIGHALGQRLMGHIERGQWQVRLLLKPANLGEVEVDLRLRAGELDATLRSMNPLTRELLVEGLPRLRDSLVGAGMEVAQLHVGSGETSRNGGNPTPRGFAQPSGASARHTDGANVDSSTASAPSVRRASADGWDVTV